MVAESTQSLRTCPTFKSAAFEWGDVGIEVNRVETAELSDTGFEVFFVEVSWHAPFAVRY